MPGGFPVNPNAPTAGGVGVAGAGVPGTGVPGVSGSSEAAGFSQLSQGRLRPSVSAESSVGVPGTAGSGSSLPHASGSQPVQRTRTGVAPGAGVGQVGTGPAVGGAQVPGSSTQPSFSANQPAQPGLPAASNLPQASAGPETDYAWAQATAAQTFQREIAPSPFQRTEAPAQPANRAVPPVSRPPFDPTRTQPMVPQSGTGQAPLGGGAPLGSGASSFNAQLNGLPSVSAPVAPKTEEPAGPPRGIVSEDQGGSGRVGMSNALRAGDLLMDEVLRDVVLNEASDLHLSNRSIPMIRKAGALRPLPGYEVLDSESLRRSVYSMLTQKQREVYEDKLELDFAYQVPGGSRFRVNLYQQRDSVGAAFRVIPSEIKLLEDLGVPPVVASFSKLPRGLVLVTGPTGSGKSTTLASIVDLANRTRPDHIMTVEDPIEFLHEHKKALVNQREVGVDTWSFAAALKHVLRQDPDIILVGEMRDLETISVALTAAETGHLVFATLHTQDAAQTIDRVIDVFPPEQQEQIRVQLASAIQGVVCQTLCKRSNGPGRVVATEVMVATPGIRNLIREGKTHQIYSAMQAGKNQGMHTMDQHLADLVKTGAISYETGIDKCHHIDDFNRLAGRTGAAFGAESVNGGF